MEKELIYRLSNPGYTIYHRAALGGLAATIRAWGTNPPDGITAEVTRDHVRLAWSGQMTDQEALRRILEASFKLTADKLIDLPGQGIKAGQDDLRLAIHNGITGTFLQHTQARSAEKEVSRFELKTDDDVSEIFTYKALHNYAHQTAKGTELLDKKYKGCFPSITSIPQSVVPGAMEGRHKLQAPAEEVILLLFLMVGSAIFLLRPRTYQDKAQYCVIVPDVIDLELFARHLHRIAATEPSIKRFSNSY
jgi:CRISPR-associated protein Cas8a1/Csx13